MNIVWISRKIGVFSQSVTDSARYETAVLRNPDRIALRGCPCAKSRHRRTDAADAPQIPSLGERTYPAGLRIRLHRVHSASIPCIGGIEHVEKIIAGNENIRLLILTKEPEANMSAWLGRLAAGRSGVACDCEYSFRSFGVNYAPFGVIIDSKRKVIWFGNPKQLTEEYILKLTNNKKAKWRSRK